LGGKETTRARMTGGRRRWWNRAHLGGDGDDATGRGVTGGGEAKTSLERGTVRLAASSLAKLRKRALGLGCGVWWLLGFEGARELINEGGSPTEELRGMVG
jgi:hypothetical protein